MTKKEDKPERKELRRPNGEGSIYKLSGRRRRPWVVRVTTGRHFIDKDTDDEKEVYDREIIGYYPSKTEAKNALQNYKAGILPIVQPKDGMTLAELYQEWYKTKEGKSSYKAINGYKTAYNHLSKYYETPFTDLRTAHLQSVVDHLHKKGMSRPLLVKVKSLLSMLYNYGMQNDIVSKNYAQFIEMPKATRKEKMRFSDFDIARIEQLAKTEDMAQLLLVLIYTGFRINELLSLTRFNVDLDKMIITGGGKTEAGTDRIVPIHAKILPIIKEWIKRDDFVVIDGKVRQYDNIAKLFKAFKQKYNFDDSLTLHCTRHTCASLMAAKGIDPIYITKILGHTNYNLTAKVYTHLDTLALYQEINKI